MDEAGHIPVLLDAVLDQLDPRPGLTFLDVTLGLGGHAAAILPRLAPAGRYIGFDRDPGQLDAARGRLEPIAHEHGVALDLVHADFANARDALDRLGVERVDRLLADLGFASNQVGVPERGLSFKHDGPLDMRLDPTGGATAAELLDTLSEREIADVLYELGEERLSRKIARKIVERRGREPIRSTRQLAELARAAYGPRGRNQRIDPATRTFQALRIAVNDELAALDRLLRDLQRIVSPEGKAGLISFHSLEDRRVKQALADLEARGRGRRATRKPVTADDAEAHANPRSRSAKLRVFAFAGSTA
mgnify:CR=1 FL=1